MAARRRVLDALDPAMGTHGPDGPWVFVAWWDPAKSSPNKLRRLNHFAQAQVRKAARAAGYAAWQGAGSPRETRMVVVSVLVRRGRKMDQLNLWGCLKEILDGALVGRFHGRAEDRIFYPAMLPDDSERFATVGDVGQQTGPEWDDDPHVVLFARLADPDAPAGPVTHAAPRRAPIARKLRTDA